VSAALRWRLDGPADAPALVLSGSLGSMLEMWDAQVAALARTYRLLRYDHPGHGGSALPEWPTSIGGLAAPLLDLLDDLAIERASLCGLSLGGMVAMWIAAHRPERLERMILLCTSARLGPPEGWDERAATVRAADSVAPIAEAVVAR